MDFIEQIGRYAANRRLGGVAQHLLARPFRRGASLRYAIVYEPNRISYSQIYPFVMHAAQIERRNDVQLRFYTVEMAERMSFDHIDRVLLQVWFDRKPSVLDGLIKNIERDGAKIVAFLDSFAHNDLRSAPALNSHIAFYMKKSIFRNREEYFHVTCGDTNLNDFYNRLYGIEAPEVKREVPSGFLDKLRLSPNFFTAPDLYRHFLDQDVDELLAGRREIDVHARLGKRGTAWYSAMRHHASEAVAALAGLKVVSEGIVDRRAFIAELRRSKSCFSPFGYGELCWRDIEAIAFGAVLLKPSMDHLEVLPDIYEANVTYVPVRWDFSDLPEKVVWIVNNGKEASSIAREAFNRIKNYLEGPNYLGDVEFLFRDEI